MARKKKDGRRKMNGRKLKKASGAIRIGGFLYLKYYRKLRFYFETCKKNREKSMAVWENNRKFANGN